MWSRSYSQSTELLERLHWTQPHLLDGGAAHHEGRLRLQRVSLEGISGLQTQGKSLNGCNTLQESGVRFESFGLTDTEGRLPASAFPETSANERAFNLVEAAQLRL